MEQRENYLSPEFFSGVSKQNSVDPQYLELLQHILNHGVVKKDRTGTGTISIFDYSLKFDMRAGFPLLTSKKMFTKGVIVELIWFLRGDTNIKYLVDQGCNIWNGDCYKNYVKHNQDGNIKTMEEFIESIKTDSDFCKKWGELGPIYGSQWRKWSTNSEKNGKKEPIDQIQKLIDDLKTNPDSRRLKVTAWNPACLDDVVLPPCHTDFQCYTSELFLDQRIDQYFSTQAENSESLENVPFPLTRNFIIDPPLTKEQIDANVTFLDSKDVPRRSLSLKFSMRSTDVPLGLPFNIASYGFLLCLLAKEVNMVPGYLSFSGGDCHIYLNQVEGVKKQLEQKFFPLPTLHLKNKSINELDVNDFVIENYKSSPSVSFPLSN